MCEGIVPFIWMNKIIAGLNEYNYRNLDSIIDEHSNPSFIDEIIKYDSLSKQVDKYSEKKFKKGV